MRLLPRDFVGVKVIRRSTYDAGMMREKIRRARTRSFHKALEDEVFKPASPTRSESPTPAADKEKKENLALKEELKQMKEKYIELTKVNCLLTDLQIHIEKLF